MNVFYTHTHTPRLELRTTFYIYTHNGIQYYRLQSRIWMSFKICLTTTTARNQLPKTKILKTKTK